MSENRVEAAIIKREFKAPQQLVYEAWTDIKHLCKWQVPNSEVKCEYLKADIRDGGSALHQMLMPNGKSMYLLTQYIELRPFSKIVFSQHQASDAGEIIPMPGWPKEIRATIELSESSGVTQMTFQWAPVNPTAEEAAAWQASLANMSGGWASSFELLENYLQQNK